MSRVFPFLESTNYPRKISLHIRSITDILRKELQSYGVRAIALTGSASRGEIGLIAHQGVLIPFGDYDFVAECRQRPPYQFIERLRWKINSTLFCGTERTRGPLIDIGIRVSRNAGSINCDLSTYDMLSTYKILWGKDCYRGIQLRLEEVPAVSFFRLMMNRFSHLTISYSQKFLTTEPDTYERIDIAKNIAKTYIEIANVLLFLRGKYHPLISEKVRLLNEIDLSKPGVDKLPELVKRIDQAATAKMSPHAHIYPNHFVARKQAGKHVLLLLPRLLRDMGIADGANLREALSDEVAQMFFIPYLEFFIKRYAGIEVGHSALKLFSMAANVYERWCVCRRTRSAKYLLHGWRSPIVDYYWLTYLLFVHSCNSSEFCFPTDIQEEIRARLPWRRAIDTWEKGRLLAKELWVSYAGRQW